MLLEPDSLNRLYGGYRGAADPQSDGQSLNRLYGGYPVEDEVSLDVSSLNRLYGGYQDRIFGA